MRRLVIFPNASIAEVCGEWIGGQVLKPFSRIDSGGTMPAASSVFTSREELTPPLSTKPDGIRCDCFQKLAVATTRSPRKRIRSIRSLTARASQGCRSLRPSHPSF